VLDRAISSTADVNVVKGYTRAGMGLCQGRNCARQIAASIAKRHGEKIEDVPFSTPRAPVRPVPIAAFADHALTDEGFFTLAE
ncbi:MAG: hypothetical protein ABI990_05740, partial [Actinomycetota bacterium]